MMVEKIQIRRAFVMQYMIENGVTFKAFRVANWFDCGKKENLLSTNATLLKDLEDIGVNHREERYTNSVIIPPVSIAEGCNIRNSIIGPNLALPPHTVINYSIIKDSIIGSYTNLYEVVLKSSLIGSDANIHGLSQSLNIGDNTEIDLR